jgi:hypothetical protein
LSFRGRAHDLLREDSLGFRHIVLITHAGLQKPAPGKLERFIDTLDFFT